MENVSLEYINLQTRNVFYAGDCKILLHIENTLCTMLDIVNCKKKKCNINVMKEGQNEQKFWLNIADRDFNQVDERHLLNNPQGMEVVLCCVYSIYKRYILFKISVNITTSIRD